MKLLPIFDKLLTLSRKAQLSLPAKSLDTREELFPRTFSVNKNDVPETQVTPSLFKGLMLAASMENIFPLYPFDNLSFKDKAILQHLRELEEEHSRFKPLDTATWERNLALLSKIDQVIQKADTEFAVLVVNEKIIVWGFGSKLQASVHDSARTNLQELKTYKENNQVISFFTHNHPDIFKQGDSGIYVPQSLSTLDLSYAVKHKLNLMRAIDYSGVSYTVISPDAQWGEGSANDLGSENWRQSPSLLEYLLLRDQEDESCLSQHKCFEILDARSLSPELIDHRGAILKNSQQWEEEMPGLAVRFGFRYEKKE